MSTESTRKFWRWRFGRFQVSLDIYIHHHARLPDRWVVLPRFVYDRKQKAAA